MALFLLLELHLLPGLLLLTERLPLLHAGHHMRQQVALRQMRPALEEKALRALKALVAGDTASGAER